MKKFFDVVQSILLFILGILTGQFWADVVPISIVAIVGGILLALYGGYALGVASSTPSNKKNEELETP